MATENEIFFGERSRLFFKAFDSQITFATDGNGRATELSCTKGALMCARIGSIISHPDAGENVRVCG